MAKKILLISGIVLFIAIILFLSRDEVPDHECNWANATCQAPLTCTVCGKTSGQPIEHYYESDTCGTFGYCIYCGKSNLKPLDHNWTSENCSSGFYCLRCSATSESRDHEWQSAPCGDKPVCKVCHNQSDIPNDHLWQDATCLAPQTCSRCKITQGDPLGHIWEDATCMSPKTCTGCEKTQGDKTDHLWLDATDLNPRYCKYCEKIDQDTLPERPESGKVLFGNPYAYGSQITITASARDCYIKLKNSNYEDIICFYVRANDTVTVNIPNGSYYVYFAQGSTWYGTDLAFGKTTAYGKDPELQDFQYIRCSYTLVFTFTGNFSMTDVDEEEF